MTNESLKLSCQQTSLLVVDVQERLVAAMDPDAMQRAQRAMVTLIRGATALGIPILCTEQVPKGLGPTVAAVRDVLPPGALLPEKTDFSCCGTVKDILASSGRRQIVICGMETHVCVFQTVRDLTELGYVLHVAADAVISRTAENRSVGLGLMQRSGAVITCVETVLFDLMGASKHPSFREISKLLK